MAYPAKDITDQQFGRLRALAVAPTPFPNRRGLRWLCRCEPAWGGCGAEKVILGFNLRSGMTLSCGCLRRETSPRNARLAARARRKS